MEIILAGASLNSGNKGVNALTRGQIMLILDQYGVNANITILSYTVSEAVNNIVKYNDENIEIKEIPCSRKSLIKAYIHSMTFGCNYILSRINTADAIWDISEGDSFSDIYGINRFIQHSLIKLIAIKVKTKLVIMPQTLGPFKRSFVKHIAKNILNKADKVFVRDEISKNVAKEELLIKREIVCVPDVAFYMRPDTKISIDKFIDKSDKIKVGINVSALLYNGGYTRNNMFNLKADYKKLIDTLIGIFTNMVDVDVILIPHVMTKDFEVEDDFRVCEKIAKNINRNGSTKVNTIDKFYREDEIKAIIGGCDFFIGSRMHACIGGISCEVPTAPIAYSRKFIGIWEKIDLGYCVTDPRNQSQEEIIESIMGSFKNRENIKIKLEERIPLLKKDIEEIVSIIEGK